MATAKQKASLKRKLSYLNNRYGYTFVVADVNHNYKALKKQHSDAIKKNNLLRKVKNYNKLIKNYNELASPVETHNNRKINIEVTEKNFSTKKRQENLKNLRKSLNKAIKTQGRDKAVLPDIKDRVVKIAKELGVNLKQKDILKKSIGKLTRDIDDYFRINSGLLPFQEQVYYDNFLKAAYRSGSKKLFITARDKGWQWVNKLLDTGFSIVEVYTYADETDDITDPTYLTDQELEQQGYNSLYPEKSNVTSLKETKWGKNVYKQAQLFLKAFK